MLLFITFFSILGALIWTVIDRKALNYNNLFYWLTVAVRFYVGIMLIHYGAVKVIKLQFPSPSFSRLTQAYGESSPMGLAWTFLGFSKGYNLFMGIAELMAGLLLFRKTVTIGAFLTLMTAANIMAVNYFYDVPVKILSTALVLMCLFLLAPNFSRLFKLFFAGEAVKLRILVVPVSSKKWLRRAKYSLKFLIILFIIAINIFINLKNSQMYGDYAPKSPLYGAYTIDSIKGAEHSETRKWKVLMMEDQKYSVIKFKGEGREYCDVKIDTIKKSISFVYNKDFKNPQIFHYVVTDPDHLVLKGKFANDSVVVELTKMRFPLIDRGFNWVNERPFNR